MTETSEEEFPEEKVITALKFLADQCDRLGLPDYGEIIDEAAQECLKLLKKPGNGHATSSTH